MARTQSRTHPDVIYRVVLTVEWGSGRINEFVYGPYASVGTAKSVANQKANNFRKAGDVDVKFVIQKAVTTWERIGD